MNLTDDMLRDAAVDMRNAMLDSLSDLDISTHTFSPRFERKMRRVIRRQKPWYRLLQRVAVAFLVLLLGSGLWLVVDVNASSVFLEWMQNVYKNSIVYQFFGDMQEEPKLEDYRPVWLPKGYVETDRISTDAQTTIEYRNTNDEVIYFQSIELDEHTQEEIVLDGMAMPIDISVNGMPGKYYQAKDAAQSNVLLWFDAEHTISFSLHSYLDKSIMLHIAESVSLDDVTN